MARDARRFKRDRNEPVSQSVSQSVASYFEAVLPWPEVPHLVSKSLFGCAFVASPSRVHREARGRCVIN